MTAEPNSCAVCGVPYRHHAMEWHRVTGLHVWQEPSNELRLKRMRARRGEQLLRELGVCPYEDCAHPRAADKPDCGEHEEWMT